MPFSRTCFYIDFYVTMVLDRYVLNVVSQMEAAVAYQNTFCPSVFIVTIYVTNQASFAKEPINFDMDN